MFWFLNNVPDIVSVKKKKYCYIKVMDRLVCDLHTYIVFEKCSANDIWHSDLKDTKLRMFPMLYVYLGKYGKRAREFIKSICIQKHEIYK